MDGTPGLPETRSKDALRTHFKTLLLIAQASRLEMGMVEDRYPPTEDETAESERRRRWVDAAVDRARVSQRLLARMPATNLDEAAVQLAVAAPLALRLHESAKAAGQPVDVDEVEDLVSLLWSAAAAVASRAGIDLAAYGIAPPAELAPWAATADGAPVFDTAFQAAGGDGFDDAVSALSAEPLPEEATPEMLLAGHRAAPGEVSNLLRAEMLQRIWQAMVRCARPQATGDLP
jgi:hypothetical protein